MNIIKAARPINLLILLCVQIMSVYFLGFGNHLADVFNKGHLIIYTCTLLCAAFGYLSNDVMDAKTDAINRSSRHYLADPKVRKLALYLSVIIAVTSLFIALTFSLRLGMLIGLILVLLFLYNSILKNIPLLGNIVIAVLGGFSIFILLSFDNNLNKELIIIFSINAFGIHLIREILKDMEDVKGDHHAGYRTLPLVLGMKNSRLIVLVILFIYILVFTTCVRWMMMRFFTAPLSYVFLAYNIICIGFPLFNILSKLQNTYKEQNYTELNRDSLYVMITGTLSMMFF